MKKFFETKILVTVSLLSGLSFGLASYSVHAAEPPAYLVVPITQSKNHQQQQNPAQASQPKPLPKTNFYQKIQKVEPAGKDVDGLFDKGADPAVKSQTAEEKPPVFIDLSVIGEAQQVFFEPLALKTNEVVPQQDYAVKVPLVSRALLMAATKLPADLASASERLIAVGQRGHIIYSDDLGKSWKQANVPTKKSLTDLVFINEQTGFAVGHDTVLLRTDDRGENWTKLYENAQLDKPFLSIDFDSKCLFASGAYGLLIRSCDAGQSWEKITFNKDFVEVDSHLNQTLFLSGNSFMLLGEFGDLFYLNSNEGNTPQITKMHSPYNGSFFGGFLVDAEGSVLMYGLRGNVFVGSPRSQNWAHTVLPTGEAILAGSKIGNSIILVGNGGQINISHDLGQTFKSYVRQERINYTGVLGLDDQHILLIGENGAEVFDLDKLNVPGMFELVSTAGAGHEKIN